MDGTVLCRRWRAGFDFLGVPSLGGSGFNTSARVCLLSNFFLQLANSSLSSVFSFFSSVIIFLQLSNLVLSSIFSLCTEFSSSISFDSLSEASSSFFSFTSPWNLVSSILQCMTNSLSPAHPFCASSSEDKKIHLEAKLQKGSLDTN